MTSLDAIMQRLGAQQRARPGYRPPTEKELRRFEDEIGGPLPAGYRQFLVAYGETVCTEGAEFGVPGWDDVSAVSRFFGLYPTPDQGIEMLTLQRFAGRIPDETIPVADALMGDLILLGFDGFDANRVWLWDHAHSRGYATRMPEIRADLAARGKDPESLDDHAAIWFWERLVPEKAPERLGFSNCFLLAETFEDFLNNLDALRNE
jgi:hypothetical protein